MSAYREGSRLPGAWLKLLGGVVTALPFYAIGPPDACMVP
jgi:hypothetical protein